MARMDDMTRGRPSHLLVRFALPLMAGSAMQLLYSIADSAIVGRLIGVGAFAAVSATGFAYWLLMDIVLGMSQGFGTLLAQRRGAGDEAAFKRAAGTAVVLMAALGAALAVLGAALAGRVLVWLGTPTDILGEAVQYLRILSGGMILTAVYNLLGTMLQSIGDSRTPVRAMLVSTVLNIALDIPLVMFMGWGVAGVAATTLVSQAVAVVYCAVALSRSPDAMPSAADIRIDPQSARALLNLGAPGALRNGITSLGGLAVQAAVNGYGSQFVAGVALPGRLYALMGVVGSALDGAVAIYVAQNWGAGRLDRIVQGMRAARRMMLGSAVAIAVLLLGAGGPLMALMVGTTGTQQVLHIAQRQLWVMLGGLPALYMLYLYRSAVQGMGDALSAMVSGFLEMGTRLVCVWVLANALGEWGVYMAISAGWPVAMAFVMVAYRAKIRNAQHSMAPFGKSS